MKMTFFQTQKDENVNLKVRIKLWKSQGPHIYKSASIWFFIVGDTVLHRHEIYFTRLIDCLVFYVASGIYQPYNGALILSPIDTWSHVPNPCKTNTQAKLYYPHPHDTTKFIQCTADGEMYIIQCPEGKEYNPSVTECAKPLPTTVRIIFYHIVTICIILYHCHDIYRSLSFTIIVQLYHAHKHRVQHTHNTYHDITVTVRIIISRSRCIYVE